MEFLGYFNGLWGQQTYSKLVLSPKTQDENLFGNSDIKKKNKNQTIT